MTLDSSRCHTKKSKRQDSKNHFSKLDLDKRMKKKNNKHTKNSAFAIFGLSENRLLFSQKANLSIQPINSNKLNQGRNERQQEKQETAI
jgi:hypothetical protein